MVKASRFAEIVISSHSLTPNELSNRIGILPDQSRVKGTLDKRLPQYDVNEWALREQSDYSLDPSQLVSRLIDRFALQRDRLQTLVNDENCEIHLSIWRNDRDEWDDGDEPDTYVGADFNLNADVVAWLASIGASLNVEGY